VITLDLTILESTASTMVVEACDSYDWIDGNTYTASNNTATYTMPNHAGCDSVITLDLTILESTASTMVVEACDSYDWIDGNTYTASNNTATYTMPNNAGCDSVITLDLTILESTASTMVVEACDSYDWIDGNTYTASNNTATYTMPNNAGCDSVITLDLTILESTASTMVVEACDSYDWIDGNTYTASNNTATHTIPNAAGCDSVITLDLTILESTASTMVIEACDSYDWIDGNTYTASSNTATYTMPNNAGCDSVITLDLTILESTVSTMVVEACDSYDWIDGNTYTASNNTATYTMPNHAGCDSVITLDLTILESTASTMIVEACDSYDWIDGNTYTASNNTATYTIPNAAGCDSVITLDLTINTVDVSVSNESSSITANAENASFQWLNCEDYSVIEGETNGMYQALVDGTYAVEVTQNSCVDTSECVVLIFESISEFTNKPSVVVYPNPAKDYINIDFNSIVAPIVRIYNLKGQKVFEKKQVLSDKLKINLDFESGVYFVEISSGKQTQRVKMIKL
jgi:hypothetical protein